MTTTDYPDWMSPGQQVSSMIAAGSVAGTPGGTPLLHGFNWLNNAPVTTTVSANSSTTVVIDNITRPGYIISILAAVGSSNSTIPFLGVELIWRDQTSGVTTAIEQWYITCYNGTPTPNPHFGKGPTKGNSVKITFTNYDPTYNMTVTWGIGQTTQHISRDDWRGQQVTNNPVFTALPNADPLALILGSGLQAASPANTTYTWLLPLYAGQAEINVIQNVSQAIALQVNAIDPLVTGAAFTSLPIYYMPTAASTEFGPLPLYLPRCPCTLQVTTGAAVSTIRATVTSLEYAS
jgi:hypothetical protein